MSYDKNKAIMERLLRLFMAKFMEISTLKKVTSKVPVAAPSFMYYLNPKPLDKNLEWDMKTNLCPNPGSLNQKQP